VLNVQYIEKIKINKKNPPVWISLDCEESRIEGNRGNRDASKDYLKGSVSGVQFLLVLPVGIAVRSPVIGPGRSS
jgi:hypothetical protein